MFTKLGSSALVCILLTAACSIAFTQQEAPPPDQQNPSRVQVERAPDESDQNAKKKSKRGSFVGIPIPVSSPAIGSGVTLVGGYIFPISRNDKISPPSFFGGGALFTNNGSRAYPAASELYFKENRYHAVAAFGHGDVNYEFYGIGNIAGNAGRKFALEQTGTLFFGLFQRRIPGQVFIGPRVWMATTSLAAQHAGETFPNLPPLNIGFDMRALGFQVERDTMANRFYPENGTSLKLSSDFFSKNLGGSFSFQSYQFTWNTYHALDRRQVLAYNLFLCSTNGNAPFFGECIFGARNELRGYQAGRYIDKKMVATQAEYRLVLPWRLGLVAFGGIGEVGPSFGKFNTENILPSAGAGVRFNLSKQYHVNIRADGAYGKNGGTFSMGLAEAF